MREALVSRSSPKASTRPPVREMRGPRNRVAESIILRRCEATVLVDPDPMQLCLERPPAHIEDIRAEPGLCKSVEARRDRWTGFVRGPRRKNSGFLDRA